MSRNWIKYPRFEGQFHQFFYAPHVQALSTDRAFSETAKKLEVIELDRLIAGKHLVFRSFDTVIICQSYQQSDGLLEYAVPPVTQPRPTITL